MMGRLARAEAAELSGGDDAGDGSEVEVGSGDDSLADDGGSDPAAFQPPAPLPATSPGLRCEESEYDDEEDDGHDARRPFRSVPGSRNDSRGDEGDEDEDEAEDLDGEDDDDGGYRREQSDDEGGGGGGENDGSGGGENDGSGGAVDDQEGDGGEGGADGSDEVQLANANNGRFETMFVEITQLAHFLVFTAAL
jgi:hypothetical protein